MQCHANRVWLINNPQEKNTQVKIVFDIATLINKNCHRYHNPPPPPGSLLFDPWMHMRSYEMWYHCWLVPMPPVCTAVKKINSHGAQKAFFPTESNTKINQDRTSVTWKMLHKNDFFFFFKSPVCKKLKESLVFKSTVSWASLRNGSAWRQLTRSKSKFFYIWEKGRKTKWIYCTESAHFY